MTSASLRLESGQTASPRLRARIAGVFYLLCIVTGAYAAMAGGGRTPYAQAANLFATACYVAVTLLFYGLFKPVNKRLSLLAALFSLAGCTLSILSLLHLASPPVDPLVLFGCYCLLLGYLIVRSTFLPRILGVLISLAGLGWVTFLSPPFAKLFTPYLMALGLLGEGSLTLWLLVAGVNSDRWNQQAGTNPAGAN